MPPNSGNSSRNRTPLWASEISPGRACAPPPTIAATEVAWCGLRNGRRSVRRPSWSSPATRGDHADLEDLGRVERREQAGQARREHRLAGAGRADQQEVVAAGRGDLEGALGGLLALDVGELGVARGGCSTRRRTGGAST